MGVDFLGKKGAEASKTPEEIKMHIPEKDGATKGLSRKQLKKQLKLEEKKKLKENRKAVRDNVLNKGEKVDLSTSFLRRQKIKRSIIIVFVSIIAIGFGGYGVYVLIQKLPKKQSKKQHISVPAVTPVKIQAPTTAPTTEPSPTTTKIQESIPSGDTELKPLRGALVKFSGGGDIFLVEENGELRLVDQENVIFDNGQTLSDLNRSLIYLLPTKWEKIRRGSEDVTGQVDFDPRVVTIGELLPFIK